MTSPSYTQSFMSHSLRRCCESLPSCLDQATVTCRRGNQQATKPLLWFLLVVWGSTKKAILGTNTHISTAIRMRTVGTNNQHHPKRKSGQDHAEASNNCRLCLTPASAVGERGNNRTAHHSVVAMLYPLCQRFSCLFWILISRRSQERCSPKSSCGCGYESRGSQRLRQRPPRDPSRPVDVQASAATAFVADSGSCPLVPKA